MANQSPSNAHASPTVELYLLGLFRLVMNGTQVLVPTRKTEALLAYLALHPESHSREKLAALFWGESPDRQARLSLRVSLNYLRKLLSHNLLLGDPETIQINPRFPIQVDALLFQEQATRFLSEPSLIPDLLNLDLYHGDLLSNYFDDWIRPLREQLRNLYIDVLLERIRQARTASEYDLVIDLAYQILDADPANERAYQQLMFCHVVKGDRTGALQQYDECMRALSEELGVEPSAETNALRQWILEASAAWKSSVSRLTNLPIPLSSFVGRKQETQELKEYIRHRRLVTLTGAGGCGKTRLAIQVSTDLMDTFKDGVWWVELAALTSGTLVLQQVTKALGLRELPTDSIAEALAEYLGNRQTLLVLDNCEHVLEASVQLVHQLTSACPNLHIVTTSRERLNLTGEQVYPVPPLGLPPVQGLSLDALSKEFDAIQLFVERAQLVNPQFGMTEANAVAVAHLCTSLDGIPLALELAAARIHLFTPGELVEGLTDRFDLLTEGSRVALPRQQTLQATIDWSHNLLQSAERILFRRLSVFMGGFTLGAAENVCEGEQLVGKRILQLLSNLAAKSLVIPPQFENPQYRMLETIHEYARLKLADAGEVEQCRLRHLEYYLILVETAEAEVSGPRRLDWFKRLEREYANLNAALETSLLLHDALEKGLRLASALSQFWVWRSHISEGRYWLDKLLAASQERGIDSIALQAKVFYTAGGLALQQTDHTPTRNLLEQSATLYREIGDNSGLAHALVWLGLEASWRNDPRSARALTKESVDLFRQAGNIWGLAYALGHYGERLLHIGETDASRAALQESLLLFEELEDRWTIEVPLAHLASLMCREGNYLGAQANFERAFAIARELDDRWGLAFLLGRLGDLARSQGEYERASGWYQEGLALLRTLGVKERVAWALVNLGCIGIYRGNYEQAAVHFIEALHYNSAGENSGVIVIANCLLGLAQVSHGKGRLEPAARLLGATATAREVIGFDNFSRDWHADYDRTAGAVRAELNEATFASAWARGRAVTLAQVIEFVLQTENELSGIEHPYNANQR